MYQCHVVVKELGYIFMFSSSMSRFFFLFKNIVVHCTRECQINLK